MGRKHAKVISRDAFMQAFVEAEMRMRKALSDKIQDVIDKETNADVKSGLTQAQTIIFGTVEE
jgi:hypothetical protein